MKLTPLRLARLTAALASNRRPDSSTEITVAVNLSRCGLQIRGAELLWDACREFFKQIPAQDRRGLRVEDLAMLAATLARGKPMRNINRRYLASEALRLWQRCKQRSLPPVKSSAAFRKQLKELETFRSSNRPSKFPISLNKALQNWLPRKRLISERVHLFRHYLRECFKLAFPDEPENSETGFFTPTERNEGEQIGLADTEMARFRKEGVNAEEYDDPLLSRLKP